MIYCLTGKIVKKSMNAVVLSCGGVGYYAQCPASVAGALPGVGKEATIYTVMSVTENDVSLYGFATEQQQACFEMLTAVSGVGPKVGLAILSVMEPDRVALAISAGDHKAFKAASGVGPKLAQRIVLELKDKVARGVAWSMAEKIGSMLLAMAVRLVILRLLTRDILGFMSIPSAVVTVLLVIVDSGFSQSLVRHKGPSQSDYKSVFLFNIAVSAVLYGVLVALAPLAARWYGMPEIARIAPVFFLLLPLNALCAVQNTIFIRQFRFALLSKVTFLSSLAGGLTAIALALVGWGIWSLVAERVIAVGMRTALLWWLSDWRPCGKCGLKPLREMAPFGCSLMVTDLISNFYNKIPQFFLGKLYSPAVLGSFDQAVKLKDMPAATRIQAVQNVTFPALAKIRDDAPRFAEGYRQVVMVVSYVMFPIMLGMSAVARDMFAVLLGEEWMPTVPYFEAVCLAGLFSPIALTAYNVLKARCKGPLIVRLEVVKKIIMTAIFAVTIPHSVMAVVWGLVAIAFCEMAVNFLATMRFTSLTFRRFVRTLLPVALVSGTMYLLVRLTAAAIPGNDLVRLLAELATGVVSYLALSALFRLEAFREVTTIVRRQLKK